MDGYMEALTDKPKFRCANCGDEGKFVTKDLRGIERSTPCPVCKGNTNGKSE